MNSSPLEPEDRSDASNLNRGPDPMMEEMERRRSGIRAEHPRAPAGILALARECGFGDARDLRRIAEFWRESPARVSRPRDPAKPRAIGPLPGSMESGLATPEFLKSFLILEERDPILDLRLVATLAYPALVFGLAALVFSYFAPTYLELQHSMGLQPSIPLRVLSSPMIWFVIVMGSMGLVWAVGRWGWKRGCRMQRDRARTTAQLLRLGYPRDAATGLAPPGKQTPARIPLAIAFILAQSSEDIVAARDLESLARGYHEGIGGRDQRTPEMFATVATIVAGLLILSMIWAIIMPLVSLITNLS